VSDDKIIVVIGERFSAESPRQRALDAQRVVKKVAGKKRINTDMVFLIAMAATYAITLLIALSL
jgi:hypothetical protein